MAIVDEEVSTEGRGREIVNATRAVGDVTKDKAMGDRSEGGENVGKDKGVHEEAFRQL